MIISTLPILLPLLFIYIIFLIDFINVTDTFYKIWFGILLLIDIGLKFRISIFYYNKQNTKYLPFSLLTSVIILVTILYSSFNYLDGSNILSLPSSIIHSLISFILIFHKPFVLYECIKHSSEDCINCKCSICLESMNSTFVYLYHCNHHFIHKDCFLKLDQRYKEKCILCMI